MRIVSIHVDSMKYRAVSKTKFAEPLDEDAGREGSMTEGVVLLTCVELNDEFCPEEVVKSAVENILKRLDKIKCRRVMIYPYAHLSSGLASPKRSLEILKSLEEALKDEGLEVTRAAFGWYKEFDMKSKGHPLADLSMTICPKTNKTSDFNCHCPYCRSPLKKEELA